MPTNTASGAYRQQQEAVKSALAEIRALLRQHARQQKCAPTNYGYAGDLAHVAEGLRDVAGFLAGWKG
jgi:hypothetical protein